MTESPSDRLASSLERLIYGLLLATLGFFGVGMTEQLTDGNVLVGLVGIVTALLCGSGILYLLYEGFREGLH
ncbi:hypothetical protein [Halapricum salinum]|uniref:hypothetical protein n=1 Tax=Halapricum salinum TaxID=1457250 RepID=UPI0010A58F3B|nr:hypothetical protein [Halapricum salinum]